LLSELGRGGGAEEELFGDETDPLFFSWRLCDVAPLGPLDRQKLLEIDGVDERLTALTAMTEEVADDLHRILAEGGPR
jgi:Lon protease-like protein